MTLTIFALTLGKSEQSANQADACIPDKTINKTDAALHLKNGVYYYNKELFSGFIAEYFPDGSLASKSGYINGKLDGLSETWFTNGLPESKRFYKNGNKAGAGYSWYRDGTKRFEYNFDPVTGLTEGKCTDWYQSGKIWQEIEYHDGKEVKVKAWRTNGKLYANYEVKDGVIYGMNNSNLCYSLADGQGKYK